MTSRPSASLCLSARNSAGRSTRGRKGVTQCGLVFAFGFFDHALGKDRTYQTPDGRTVTAGPIQPNGWEIAELFKIERGLIRRVEANMVSPPYGMTSGWSSWEEGLSSAARDVTGVK